MDMWTGSMACATALDLIDDIARSRHSITSGVYPAGNESADVSGLEGAFMSAIGNWLDGIKTWMYEAKKSIASAVASAIAAAGAFKAFRHLSAADNYFKAATAILESEEGKQALAQLADPKHKSMYSKITRFFTKGKDLTHLVMRAETLNLTGKHNLKIAALTALMSIVIAIGVKLSIGKLKSTPYAVDQILKLPLPTTKELYDEYIRKVSTIVTEHSYIGIDGYVVSAIASEEPSDSKIEEKITVINAISTSIKSVPERIAVLTKSEAAKTQFGRKGLHFTIMYLEKMIRETTTLTSHIEQETSHLSSSENSDYGR